MKDVLMVKKLNRVCCLAILAMALFSCGNEEVNVDSEENLRLLSSCGVNNIYTNENIFFYDSIKISSVKGKDTVEIKKFNVLNIEKWKRGFYTYEISFDEELVSGNIYTITLFYKNNKRIVKFSDLVFFQMSLDNGSDAKSCRLNSYYRNDSLVVKDDPSGADLFWIALDASQSPSTNHER